MQDLRSNFVLFLVQCGLSRKKPINLGALFLFVDIRKVACQQVLNVNFNKLVSHASRRKGDGESKWGKGLARKREVKRE